MAISPLSFQQYQSYCESHHKVPLALEVLADTETPLSAYLKLANDSYSFLFESIEGGEKWGRYSIIGLQCTEYIVVRDNQVKHQQAGKIIFEGDVDNPLDYIDDCINEIKVPRLDNLPRFYGGFVGYFGYDTIRYVEPRLKHSAAKDVLKTPDITLFMADELVVFDTVSGTLTLITHAQADGSEVSYEQAIDRLKSLREQLSIAAPTQNQLSLDAGNDSNNEISEKQFISSIGQQRYHQIVEHIKNYIQAGDVMQVVPSQRLSIEFKEQPLDLYRALRYLNPSPYMYLLNCGDFHIIGSSPEILARIKGDIATVRPLAGTRKRGQNAVEDELLKENLLADTKEIAEHLMLIDLGRNDIGKVSQIGTVEVTDKMFVEYYSHVMHITSNVIGRLKKNTTAIDVIKATHPAGTLSGAPKIRAMEIIDEVETVKRGIYAGAVGYIGWQDDGFSDMDLAIAIRTALIKDNQLHVQAGGGVVADSIPETEWQETLNKARAMFRAVNMVKHSTSSKN